MEHADIAQVAAVGGALGSILALLARGRVSLLAGLALLVAAEGGLAYALGGDPTGKLGTTGGAAAALLGGGALLAAVALLVRRPALLPLAVLVAAPLRPPLEYDASATLLVTVAEDGALGRLLPLYFVLLAATLALAWRALRGPGPQPLPSVLALPASAFFAFALASLLWADDLEAGANLVVFFTLPFAALVTVVARAPYPPWLKRALAVTAIALGCLFALVGLWQAITHELFFFAPNLEVSNANTDYFRVTSLFGDPSLYGRHLVLALGVVLALLATRRLRPWAGIGLLALLWAGLLFSYSQSSMVALVVVTLGVALATGDASVRRAVGGVAALAVLIALGYAGYQLASGETLKQLTSDRTERVEDTARVIERDPILGVGLGGQPPASRDLADSDRPTAEFVSHTTPLTVAAELGAIGLVLYLWLLLGGARLLTAVTRRERALGLALGAAFLGLFVHALFYSGFLEDPLTWVVLAVAAGYLSWAEREAAPAAEKAVAP